MASIRDTLAKSAARYAHRALEAHVIGEQADFFLYGGLAVEHALKARLVQENPSFIAPRDHFLAAVTFSKARDDVSLVPTGTPSIGASESLKRVSALDKAIAADIAGAAELFRLRNGEAHLGTVDSTYARRTLVSFLRAINALLKIDPDKFWTPHDDFVRTVLDETSAEVVRRTASKVAAARAHFNNRRSVLSTEEVAALDAIVDADLKRRSDEENFVVDCPACESSALLSGENSLQWEPEYDEEGPSGAAPWIEYVGGYLYCDACGLELDGEDELVAAGVDSRWQNDEADIDEWLSDYYSDAFDRY